MSEAAVSFEQAIKDAEALLARFDEENSQVVPIRSPEPLKRAGLVMALAAWETYVKDRIVEEFKIQVGSEENSYLFDFAKRRLNEDIKKFFNPNTEKVRRIFLDYFDVDVTASWSWNNYDIAKAKKVLDALVAKRGDAAHKANTSQKPNGDPHLVKREELKKAIGFLRKLVLATEKVRLVK